jgi:hypothetical protein
VDEAGLTTVTTDPRWPTAIHEAGHAVVSRYVRVGIRGLTIEPDAGAKGHVWTFGPGKWFQPDALMDARTRLTIERRVMVLTAGRAAQTKVTGDYVEVKREAEQDFDMATELALHMTSGEPKEAEAYVEWLFLRTQNLFHHPLWWAAVDGLARKLLTEPKMSGPRCRQVIQEVIDDILARRTDTPLAYVDSVTRTVV